MSLAMLDVLIDDNHIDIDPDDVQLVKDLIHASKHTYVRLLFGPTWAILEPTRLWLALGLTYSPWLTLYLSPCRGRVCACVIPPQGTHG